MIQCIEAGCGRQAMRHRTRCERCARRHKAERSAQDKSFRKCCAEGCNNVAGLGQSLCRAHRPPVFPDDSGAGFWETINGGRSWYYAPKMFSPNPPTARKTEDKTMDPIFKRFTDGRKFYSRSSGKEVTVEGFGYNLSGNTAVFAKGQPIRIEDFDAIAEDELDFAMRKAEFWFYRPGNPNTPMKAVKDEREGKEPEWQVVGGGLRSRDAFRRAYEMSAIKLCDAPAEPDLEEAYKIAHKALADARKELSALRFKVRDLGDKISSQLQPALEKAQEAFLEAIGHD